MIGGQRSTGIKTKSVTTPMESSRDYMTTTKLTVRKVRRNNTRKAKNQQLINKSDKHQLIQHYAIVC